MTGTAPSAAAGTSASAPVVPAGASTSGAVVPPAATDISSAMNGPVVSSAAGFTGTVSVPSASASAGASTSASVPPAATVISSAMITQVVSSVAGTASTGVVDGTINDVGTTVAWDNSSSIISEFTRNEGFNRSSDQELLNDEPYVYLDTYQGVHPRTRNNPHPQLIYPIAKVYELLSSAASSSSIEFRVIWNISKYVRIVEDMPQFIFQSMKSFSPKLIWVKDSYDMKTAFRFPFPPVINTSFVSASVGEGSINTIIPTDLTTVSTSSSSSSSSSSVVVVTTSSTLHDVDAVVEGDNDEGLNDGMGIEVDMRAMDLDRLKWEKEKYSELKGLYTDKLKKAYVKIDVGGRGVLLNSFHYEDDENDMLTSISRCKKFEFVDLVDDILLYRWELKGCLANMIKVGRRFIERLYFALCRYRPIDPTSTRMYDCVAILITRCKDRAPIFIMKEVMSGNASKIERWGWNLMKNFYAAPEVFIDTDSLKQERYQYWRCENHLYRPEKLLLLDTKSPGVRTVLDATPENIQRAEKYWSIKPGAKTAAAPVIDLTVTGAAHKLRSATSESSPLPSSADLEIAKAQQANLLKKAEDKIAALTKQLDKLKEDKKESAKKKKQESHSSEDAAELKKLRALLVESRKENSMLQQKHVDLVAGSKKRVVSDICAGSSNEQFLLSDGARSTGKVVDNLVQVEESRKKVARLKLETANMEMQKQQVENQKGAALLRQEQLNHMTMQQMISRYDEERAFQRQVSLLQLEHKNRRDQNRDMMTMTSTANDPFNLMQMLNQQRLFLTSSPNLLSVSQQERTSSSSATSTPVTQQAANAISMLQQAVSNFQQEVTNSSASAPAEQHTASAPAVQHPASAPAVQNPHNSATISAVNLLQQLVAMQQSLRASSVPNVEPCVDTVQPNNPSSETLLLLQQIFNNNLQQGPPTTSNNSSSNQVCARSTESQESAGTDSMSGMNAAELIAEIAKVRLETKHYRANMEEEEEEEVEED
jgi:hypothetical protein